MHTALLVEEAIGRVACQSNILLDGMLLVRWQIVVNAIRLCEIVLGDDVLPLLFRRTVGKVEVYNVVSPKLGLEFVRLT